MRKVACLGILVADVIVETIDKYPEKGTLTKVNSITVHNGGNAMTASINLAKLGVDASIIGMVGTDMFGEYLERKLKEFNVNTKGLKKSDKTQTSASVPLVDNSGERSLVHCVGANAIFCEDDIDYSVIEDVDIVFVTGTFLLTTFDGIQTMNFLKKCKEMGKTTLLDVCWDAEGNWERIIDMSLPYIDYFMPSIDEAKCIANKDDVEEISDVFRSKGSKNIIIKLGGNGSYLRKEGESKGKIYPPFKVSKVVDTTGAGDSFCSGFIAGLSRGLSLDECMELANAVGSMSVTQKGATVGTKSYDETLKFINDYKERM